MKFLGVTLLAAAVAVTACGFAGRSGVSLIPGASGAASGAVGAHPGGIGLTDTLKPAGHDKLAAFSMGCFWGSENTFRHVKGVVATAVGYTGGKVANPTYEMVCTHKTGHVETVLVEYDPAVVSYADLLQTFWLNHDPTTPDRQGPDEGNNYRSAIWTFDDDQLKAAQASKTARQAKEKDPIVTQIEPIGKFWLAEDYHQQYDEKNGVDSCPIPRRQS